MTKYIVHGGKPLCGEVEISGAKNAAVAIIPAAILVDGVCRIENIPQISDVTAILKILEQLGASIRSINRHTVEIDSRHIHTTRTSYELSRKLRASYYLIGALLGRFGRAEVAMPGGCNFGGESEAYFQKVLDRVKESIDESNSIIGTYMCQGKMPMAVRERYEKMKQQPNPAPNLDGLIRNFDRALTHPDDHDLEELKQAVRRGEDS